MRRAVMDLVQKQEHVVTVHELTDLFQYSGSEGTFTMVSSMGYVVLSGKMQVDRQETTFTVPTSCAACSTLSLMYMLFLCMTKTFRLIFEAAE